MQYSVLVVVGKMLVFNDLRNFTLAVVVIHFVGKIAGEHEGLVSDRRDEEMQRLFSALATDEYPSGFYVAPDIRAYALSRSELDILFAGIVLDMGFPPAVESFEASL